MKLYLPKQKFTKNKTLISYKTVHLLLNALIPTSFPLGETLLKLFLGYETAQLYFFTFSRSSNHKLDMNYQFRKQVNIIYSLVCVVLLHINPNLI